MLLIVDEALSSYCRRRLGPLSVHLDACMSIDLAAAPCC